jgi:hypothetical protein
VGGANIDERAPSLPFFEPGPAPQITEQHVEIGPPQRLQYTLTDFDEEGFVLTLVRTTGPDAPGRTFAMPRIRWGDHRAEGYSRGVVMHVAPLRGADGAISAAQVTFSSNMAQ